MTCSGIIVGLLATLSLGLAQPAFADTGCWGMEETGTHPAIYQVDRGSGANFKASHRITFADGLIAKTVTLREPPADDGTAGLYEITVDRCYAPSFAGHSAKLITPLGLRGRLGLWIGLHLPAIVGWFILLTLLLVGYGLLGRRRAPDAPLVTRGGLIAAGAMSTIALVYSVLHSNPWIFSQPTRPEVQAPPRPMRPKAVPKKPQTPENPPAVAAEPEREDPCPRSGYCKREGRCTLQGDECRANSPDDCLASRDCAELGRCVLSGRQCVATNEFCTSWTGCAKPDACELSGDKCALSAQSCQSSEACRKVGRCSVVGDSCVARSDADCAQSEACATSGLCALRNGVCAATESKHCLDSEHCKTQESCKLGTGLFKGQCVPPQYEGTPSGLQQQMKGLDIDELQRKMRGRSN